LQVFDGAPAGVGHRCDLGKGCVEPVDGLGGAASAEGASAQGGAEGPGVAGGDYTGSRRFRFWWLAAIGIAVFDDSGPGVIGTDASSCH